MPTYRIVLKHESSEHTSIVWLGRDDDQAALEEAMAMLAPSQGGWVWDDDRPVGYAVGPRRSPKAEDPAVPKRDAVMRVLGGLFRRPPGARAT